MGNVPEKSSSSPPKCFPDACSHIAGNSGLVFWGYLTVAFVIVRLLKQKTCQLKKMALNHPGENKNRLRTAETSATLIKQIYLFPKVMTSTVFFISSNTVEVLKPGNQRIIQQQRKIIMYSLHLESRSLTHTLFPTRVRNTHAALQ